MLNHTYTSVKNANIVDCGRKQHIPSQPLPLLRNNFLGEYRTELDKKKVLANLGIATDLSLEWEYIKGDIGRNEALMAELDSRTKYISQIDGFQKTVIEGLTYLEAIVGGEEEAEQVQNDRLQALETVSKELNTNLTELKTYLEETIEVNIETLTNSLNEITKKVENITELIQVSTKEGNALILINDEETPGLYVPDLSKEVTEATTNITNLQTNVQNILDTYVTKEELGGGDFDFVNQGEFDSYVESTDSQIATINKELANTVKTGEDGHVDTLYVNQISKENDEGNIKITDSFEVTSGVPLDIRFVVKNIEQLHSLKPLVCYPGMGVIVSDQASLYILREPADGIITEEYIRDEEGINWKCPEDLIIEVLTQEEYDKKLEEDSINPHMFYYIHEEVVEEPKREDFDSDETYTEALDKWLRVLQQKYMSAVWGQEIEQLVASKASNTAIKSLESEIQRLSDLIDTLSGGSNEISLKGLNDQVQQNTENLNTLIKDNGTIPTIQKDISDLQSTVVTKEQITVDDPNVEYIFVKKTAFETYVQEHNNSIAKSVTTNNLITTDITIGTHTLNASETDLLFNNEKVALNKYVPVIEMIDFVVFKDKTDLDDNTYYYVYNDEERYVLDSEFSDYKTSLSRTTSALSESIVKNQSSIGNLENLTTTNKNALVYAINEVNAAIAQIDTNVGSLTDENGTISNIQQQLGNLQNTVTNDYVTKKSITIDDPSIEYIFVKKSAFDSYKEEYNSAIAKEISTKKVITDNVTLGDNNLSYSGQDLIFNNEKVALEKQIPNIEVIDNNTFESKTDIDNNTYYYVYDTEERHLLESEFSEYKTAQNKTNATLLESIYKNETSIGELESLTTDNKNTLVYAINELVTKINDLTSELNALKEQVSSL